MPNYEYRCPKCEFTIECSYKMDEQPEEISLICQDVEDTVWPRPTCVMRRIMSTFSGKFGDTRRFHG